MKQGRNILVSVIGILCLTACNTGATYSPIIPSPTPVPTLLSPSSIPTETSIQTPSSLPIATSTLPQLTQFPVWGMVVEQIAPGREFDQVKQAGTFWLRSSNAVSWAAIEPMEGKRNWDASIEVDAELRTISDNGMQTILSVRVTPSWAQQLAGHACGPIKPGKLGAFAGFMHDLVTRYSAPPYNVKYWEIWNEPDIDPGLVSPDSPFGCWGNKDDEYYGGGYYADMLKAVYPRIKSADPNAQVLIGGLLLDCDPRPGAGCSKQGHAPRTTMFLEGILRNGGGSYFDGVSFHAYDYYQGVGKYYDNPNWDSSWNTTGPVLIAKVKYIQSLFGKYDISGKFLIASEVAVICIWCSSFNSDLETIKSYYVAESYAAAIARGLHGTIWYSFQGWNNSGLVNTDLSALPAYTAFQFSSSELRKSVWMRNITEYPGVKGYELNRGDHRIWVLWSLDGNSHLISLPVVPSEAWDILGMPVSPTLSMNITVKPLYLEWEL